MTKKKKYITSFTIPKQCIEALKNKRLEEPASAPMGLSYKGLPQCVHLKPRTNAEV